MTCKVIVQVSLTLTVGRVSVKVLVGLTLGVGKVSGDVTVGLSSAVLQLLARARAFSNSESR